MKLYKTDFRRNLIFYALLLLMPLSTAHSAVPLTTDSRIKTFVYNENEVFHITVHYGYQSNIEFAKGEEIETLSIGNSYSWKITPVGRRLFLKALEGAARTNMTIITNKHTYQIELESKDPNDALDEELVYVVRFFYPEDSFDRPPVKISSQIFVPQEFKTKQNYNFNYSLSGPDSIAPMKVFDDNKYTYLKFSNNNAIIPQIFVINSNKSEARTSYSRQGEYIVIKKLVNKLALRLNKDVVYVFNEQNQINGAF